MNLDDRARSATRELVESQPLDVDRMLDELYRRRRRTGAVRIVAAASVVVALAVGLSIARGREPSPPQPVGPIEVTNGALVAHSIRSGFSTSLDTVTRLPRNAATTTDLQFTADGTELVYLDRSGRFVAHDLTDEDERVLGVCPAADGDCGFALSPNGRQLAVTRYDAGQGGLRIIDTETGSESRLGSELVRYPTWSPDGEELAYAGVDGLHVMAGDGSSDRLVVALDLPDGVVQGRPSWSPDGSRLSFVRGRPIDVPDAPSKRSGLQVLRYTLAVVDLGSGEVTDLGDLGYCVCLGTPAPQQTWSPDGRLIAATSVVEGPDEPLNAQVGPLYLVRPDGSGRDQLAPLEAGSLAWQPVVTRSD